MTRTARLLFGVLIVATVAAFFVAQRLKNQPAVIQMAAISKSTDGFTRVFSPNGDGRRDTLTLRFLLKRSTRVTVEVVDSDGATVATLVRNKPMRKYRRLTVKWDGRGDDGQVLDDGRYRLKFVLPDEGRSVVWPSSFQLDTTPPRPRVVKVAGNGVAPSSRPAILPAVDGKPLEATLRLRGWKPSARVVRTSPGPADVVATLPVDATERATTGTRVGGQFRSVAGVARWDGRADDGARVPAGTYVIQVCVYDAAGNRGCGPTADPDGMPVPEANGRMRGRGGVTVRSVAVQASPVPVRAGHRLTFFVDARGREYRWVLRRIGTKAAVASGTSDDPVLKVDPRSRRGAAYLLAVSAGGQRVEVPAFSNDEDEQPVLVVLPAITWQGLNLLDDDGDGLVNRLQATVGPSATRIRTSRVLNGLPPSFATGVRPAIEWLVRHRKRFEITTDLALAQQAGAEDRASGPQLEGRRGALLLGESRWTVPASAERLRKFVTGGRTVAVLEPASLHRPVELTGNARRGWRLGNPGSFDPADAFGIVSRGAVRLDGPPENDRDEIGLFSGTDGRFDGYRVGWPVESFGEGKRVASAVDGRERILIAGSRLGDGLVLRTGLPTFAGRLATDTDTSDLMGSVWRRLSR